MLTAFRNNHAFTGYLMNHQQLKPRGTYRFQLFDVGLSQKNTRHPPKIQRLLITFPYSNCNVINITGIFIMSLHTYPHFGLVCYSQLCLTPGRKKTAAPQVDSDDEATPRAASKPHAEPHSRCCCGLLSEPGGGNWANLTINPLGN